MYKQTVFGIIFTDLVAYLIPGLICIFGVHIFSTFDPLPSGVIVTLSESMITLIILFFAYTVGGFISTVRCRFFDEKLVHYNGKGGYGYPRFESLYPRKTSYGYLLSNVKWSMTVPDVVRNKILSHLWIVYNNGITPRVDTHEYKNTIDNAWDIYKSMLSQQQYIYYFSSYDRWSDLAVFRKNTLFAVMIVGVFALTYPTTSDIPTANRTLYVLIPMLILLLNSIREFHLSCDRSKRIWNFAYNEISMNESSKKAIGENDT